MSIDYINLHKEVYDVLADEYFERLSKYDTYYRTVGNKLAEFAMEELFNSPYREEYNVLELGCGPGAILSSLNDYKRVNIYAIDLSENMVNYARMSCEKANVINMNVLDIKNIIQVFNNDNKFDLIIMSAFIHLFPFADAKYLLMKISEWLVPNGFIYLDTTKEKNFEDGKIREKIGYKRTVIRLRTEFTLEKFNELIISSGYKIVKQTEHEANNEKIWIRTVAQLN